MNSDCESNAGLGHQSAEREEKWQGMIRGMVEGEDPSDHAGTKRGGLEGAGHFYCPICERRAEAFAPYGLAKRKNALCPQCGSLERHRLAWMFLQRQTDLFDGRPKRFLHVAPERCLSDRLRVLPHLTYISGDRDPALAEICLDLNALAFPDGHFDVIYCSHVLEHVEDDRKAMRELRRVLAPHGWAVLMVPINAPVTYEDARITTPEARAQAFGQRDHVRRYGPDFVDRLQESAFQVLKLSPEQIGRADELQRMAINASECVFFCRR